MEVTIGHTQYDNFESILQDIKDIKIQGATNVAIATFEGIKLYLQNFGSSLDNDVFDKVMGIGSKLAYARPNEPLAQNGLRYLNYFFRVRYKSPTDSQEVKQVIINLCDEYLNLVELTKSEMVEKNLSELGNPHTVFTHCHSSTAEKLIGVLGSGKTGFKAICTETRPLFQGRITARNLLEKGIDTTMIADSAGASYIVGRAGEPVELVLLGADEITIHGDFVNKVGSWGLSLAAYYANVPTYVVTPLLKVNPESAFKATSIELRKAEELWPDAPEGLKLFNPAFDFVSRQFVTGYITEFGIIKPENIISVLREKYGWVF